MQRWMKLDLYSEWVYMDIQTSCGFCNYLQCISECIFAECIFLQCIYGERILTIFMPTLTSLLVKMRMLDIYNGKIYKCNPNIQNWEAGLVSYLWLYNSILHKNGVLTIYLYHGIKKSINRYVCSTISFLWEIIMYF